MIKAGHHRSALLRGYQRRPALIGDLGQLIAATGRLRYLGGLGYAGEGPSWPPAQQCAALWHTLTVPDTVSAAPDGPVLLVDDRIDTGWTMTVAARLLRECGAPAVLPFALAVTN